MREILFRGKRVDNGEWVEGFVSIDGDNAIIHTKVAYYRVHPETVGQFTGLLDKSGKKIFEGDVLESYLGKSRMVGVIKWENDSWGWTQFRPLLSFEIIGNIHDSANDPPTH